MCFYTFSVLILLFHNSEEKCLGSDVLDVSAKPANHSPALILCLPKEHSSLPWQPASLFTYSVCRHTIAMTTSWLPCQFSDAIVLSLKQQSAPLTCCFSPSLLILPLIFLDTLTLEIHIMWFGWKCHNTLRAHTCSD